MRIVVVGGAGYIGSHAVRHLLSHGHEVTVYDNLSQGHRAAVPEEMLIVGELADGEHLRTVLRRARAEAVMHFAAFTSVPESVIEPGKYYQNNVVGTLNLLEAMRDVGVPRLVFSSTAAVYGVPEIMPIPETAPAHPINPYGRTKRIIEEAIAEYAQAYQLGFVALRYFNACGACEDARIGEDHQPETHLIPLILQVALEQRPAISVYGNDYPTEDGTCVRDYIHVEDLATAHRLALDHIQPGRGLICNVGTGAGVSVNAVIDAARAVTGHPIPVRYTPRRPGDPPVLVASVDLASRQLGWSPRFRDIHTIVETAWRWHVSHPNGFGDRPAH